MPYSPNMQQAAERHYIDGKKLLDLKRLNNAGYHFGFAAECATKFRLIEAGVPQTDPAIIKHHFEELRHSALLSLSNRIDSQLFSILNDSSLMQAWSTKMRYADDNSVSLQQVEKWQKQANSLMGLLI